MNTWLLGIQLKWILYLQTSSTGLYIIIALVVLIILACIAFCVYKQCYKKPGPMSFTDAGKGPYQQAPYIDPDAAAIAPLK